VLVSHLFEARASNLRIQQGKISVPEFKFQAGEDPPRRLEPGMFMKTQPVSEFSGAGKWCDGRLFPLKTQGLQPSCVGYYREKNHVVK
jgi:hypothetical protein